MHGPVTPLIPGLPQGHPLGTQAGPGGPPVTPTVGSPSSRQTSLFARDRERPGSLEPFAAVPTGKNWTLACPPAPRPFLSPPQDTGPACAAQPITHSHPTPSLTESCAVFMAFSRVASPSLECSNPSYSWRICAKTPNG